mmetsp:Transcript_5108/g.8927  ORF Transcript_5108/g.8927 Transcript_5108/m.8927 type:complete len:395 (-) Transcript_5108:273-1457(-)
MARLVDVLGLETTSNAQARMQRVLENTAQNIAALGPRSLLDEMLILASQSHIRPMLLGVDFLEIDGQPSISGCSARWCPRRITSFGGALCAKAPLLFDPANPSGLKVWGQEATGAIVVARRGASFDHIARNAELAGAVGLVIIDNRDVWKQDTELCPRPGASPNAGDLAKPEVTIPTILVPKDCEIDVCGRAGASAAIVRRKFSGQVAKPHVQALVAPLRRRISKLLRKQTDCLVMMEQAEVVPTCSADWTRSIRPRPANGQICRLAPVLFDEQNPDGLGSWPSQARNAIVVVRRGASFELVTRNAQQAGALAVIVVNNRAAWDQNLEIAQEKPPIQDDPPAIPTVLVPARMEQLLCAGPSGYRPFRAVLVRKANEDINEASHPFGLINSFRTY